MALSLRTDMPLRLATSACVSFTMSLRITHSSSTRTASPIYHW
jgi:hypothetical protein